MMTSSVVTPPNQCQKNVLLNEHKIVVQKALTIGQAAKI